MSSPTKYHHGNKRRGAVQRDEVVLLEVMAEHVDHGWWAAYREDLQSRFRQDEVLIRASAMERL